MNYLVSEPTARKVRAFAGTRLDLDEAAVEKENLSYRVHTLYLDSDKRTLYQTAINDPEHRCLLRMRYYDIRPDAPVRLEIKRRLADVVMRESCAVWPAALPMILAGQMPSSDAIADRDTSERVALEQFLLLLAMHRAKPALHVSYLRECYVSVGDVSDARITLDRQVVCQRTESELLADHFDHPTPLFHGSVLLELNYGPRCPDWFQELVEACDLTACEADKFIEGMRQTVARHSAIVG